MLRDWIKCENQCPHYPKTEYRPGFGFWENISKIDIQVRRWKIPAPSTAAVGDWTESDDIRIGTIYMTC
jgi:hypothetical protein